jgi:hypothetical protein
MLGVVMKFFGLSTLMTVSFFFESAKLSYILYLRRVKNQVREPYVFLRFILWK